FGHGLMSLGWAIEAVISSAGTAGCFVCVAMAGSGNTPCSPCCGCWNSARIAAFRGAQPYRLPPPPISKRALPNRTIGGLLGHHTMSVPQSLRIARFILTFLGEHRGGKTNGLRQPSNASDELRQGGHRRLHPRSSPCDPPRLFDAHSVSRQS